MDPAANAVTYPGYNTIHNLEIKMPQSSRRMVSEDFQDLPSYAAFRASEGAYPVKPLFSLGEEMLKYFNVLPPGWQAQPSILSLAYYPLQSAISEWRLYRLLMSRYIKYYEYSFPAVPSVLEELATDILDPHRWRRRSQQSLHKLQMTGQFVEQWRAKERTFEREGHPSPIGLSRGDLLVMDLKYLEDQIEQHARSLEAFGPIMTSLVQLVDSRRSIAQAEDVRRLTYVAIGFISLTFVSGIFSMSGPFAPGEKFFWVYFIVAVPLAAGILLVVMQDLAILVLYAPTHNAAEEMKRPC